MVYTPEEKLRMDKLLEVFEDYIAESQEMDIAYAPKTGYVWLVVAENADWVYFPVKGYDDLLEKLCSCMVMEEEERSVVSVGDYSMVDTQRIKQASCLLQRAKYSSIFPSAYPRFSSSLCSLALSSCVQNCKMELAYSFAHGIPCDGFVVPPQLQWLRVFGLQEKPGFANLCG